MAYVYRHIRKDKNQPFYIGIGSDDNYNRAHSKANRNKHWNNIVNKTNYTVQIIIDNITWEEACEKEIEFILLYGKISDGFGILCNITDGGGGILGYKHSVKTKIKISKSQIGELNHRYGKILTDEHRNKISESLKIISDDIRNRVSAYRTGKKHSYEARLKMSKSKIGFNNPKSRPVLNIIDGVYYDCVKDAAYAYGIGYNSLMSKMYRDKHKKYFIIYI